MLCSIYTASAKLQSLNYGYQTLLSNPTHSVKKTKSSTIKSCTPEQDLLGQSVAVVGLGKSGRSAARLALARGASVLAIDQNVKLGLLEQDPLFEKYSGLRTILGYVDHDQLRDTDIVVVSPGIPIQNYGLSSLLQSGKRVMSELDFAAEVLPKSIKILAVTGTNGKSTVVTFAGQMLHHLGIKAFVGGNLGDPLSEASFQCLTMSSRKHQFQIAVVEVSSYQMEIPSNYFCPSVVVVLSLTPDHLERHKSMRNYAIAKCRLFSRMTDSKLGLLCFGNQHLNEAIQEHTNKLNLAWIGAFPGVKVDVEEKIAHLEVPSIGVACELPMGELKSIGTHNYYNAAVAALCILGLDVGVNIRSISSTIGELRPPPHRMQIVHKDVNGVTWIDDSKATNVAATYTGLMGLKGHKSLILLGGLAKVLHGQESNGFEKLIEVLNNHRCIVAFGSSGKLIQKTLCDNGLSVPCIRVENLKDAVNYARSTAKNGNAIVLSPGCASFDEFRNFEHRGLVFQELSISP